jgi:hypothetical protein
MDRSRVLPDSSSGQRQDSIIGEIPQRRLEMAYKTVSDPADINDKIGFTLPEIVVGQDNMNAINVTNLTLFSEIIAYNSQGFNLTDAIVVIDTKFNVSLLSAPYKDNVRKVYMKAVNPSHKLELGHKYEIQKLPSLLRTSTRYGHYGADVAREFEKSYITGKAISSTELYRKYFYCYLKPYMIFTECEQTLIKAVIEISGDQETGMFVEVIETDGGAWKLKAQRSIATKLVKFGVRLPIYY